MKNAKEEVEIAYDKEVDALYVSFGKPSKTEAEEVQRGVFARYNQRTKKLAGFTVINFSKKFKAQPKHISIPAAMPA